MLQDRRGMSAASSPFRQNGDSRLAATGRSGFVGCRRLQHAHAAAHRPRRPTTTCAVGDHRRAHPLSTSAPGLGAPPATSAPGLGPPLPHLRRDCAGRWLPRTARRSARCSSCRLHRRRRSSCSSARSAERQPRLMHTRVPRGGRCSRCHSPWAQSSPPGGRAVRHIVHTVAIDRAFRSQLLTYEFAVLSRTSALARVEVRVYSWGLPHCFRLFAPRTYLRAVAAVQ